MVFVELPDGTHVDPEGVVAVQPGAGVVRIFVVMVHQPITIPAKLGYAEEKMGKTLDTKVKEMTLEILALLAKD